MSKKILIVKLGYTETIDNRITSHTVSLGDVLRTTAILHLFKDDEVTWLTSKESLALLSDNPYIKHILIYDSTCVFQLGAEYFDVVINLEKAPEICVLVDSVKAHKKFGFRFDKVKRTIEAYEHSYDALANSDDPALRRKLTKHWIEMLYEMVGERWNGESYILGYKPKTKEKFDIGFNTQVNKRWTNKAWPKGYWNELEALIGADYSVSYQRSLNNIEGYIDWINSCRVVITNDSLGLHLAIALKKKIIALFGPTSDKELHFFGQGECIRPFKKMECMPCFNTVCQYGRSCMYDISPKEVYRKLVESLNERE